MATITPRAAEPARPSDPRAGGLHAEGAWRFGLEYAGLGGVMLLSGLLEFVKLGQNGFANIYYSAAVKSMLQSWHAFFFVTADPNGLITVDKPPLGLWVQGLSAKIFGFTPLSLIVPEGICAVLAVALLYRIVMPRFGRVAALLSALTLAVFPSFVAVSRDNAIDPVLIVLMLGACGAALNAIDSGRLRSLVLSAVLLGLAFETKTLASLLCVPGIGLGYLVCAPVSLRRRLLSLVGAGALFLVVAFAWIAAVQLTPASQRPFIGSTSANSEIQLTFGYNGFGRVGGQQGGPGGETKSTLNHAQEAPLVRPFIDTRGTKAMARELRRHPPAPTPPVVAPKPGRHRLLRPLPFGGTRSPLRIFSTSLGDQAGWLVPLALLGVLALGLAVRRRDDRRTAGLFVLGGWFLVELATLDFSAGIVHPYYSSALGPGLAAMVGAGSVAIASLLRSDRPRRALAGYAIAVVGIVATVAVQLVLIHREDDPLWWRLPMVLLCAAGLAAIVVARRFSGWALGVAVAALLVAPIVYSFTTLSAPVAGTFPTAGRYAYAGHGGVGVTSAGLKIQDALIRYLDTHGATQPYPLLTQSSDQADPLILLGLRATAVGGYNTTDPAMSGTQLATLVTEHKARYFLIAGPYASRGGNGASTAARLVCPEVVGRIWAAGTNGGGSYLVDCAGKQKALLHPYASARAFIRRERARGYRHGLYRV
ncbi:MAG TPA: glycosyltransferase family 39 protein [Solirubrobacteraceae bacterium]|jgi:4-amino-4-deoxy-L-arabinose transferase-like glycosyltransferase